MELRDDQPMKHEIGNRTYIVADVDPLDVDGVRTVEVGSALWLIGFVALLPFYGELQDNGRVWWLWTCLAGFGLGLFGLEYCRRRRKARAERDSTRTMPAEGPPPTRWQLAGESAQGYGEHFARLVADGDDIDGEARLADALAPRGARILDVGSGMGRVAERCGGAVTRSSPRNPTRRCGPSRSRRTPTWRCCRTRHWTSTPPSTAASTWSSPSAT